MKSGIGFNFLDLLFDDKVVEGFADEKIGPCQGDIGQGGFEEPGLRRDGFGVKFSNAEVGHKNGAIDYEKSIQKIPVYRGLPPQKKDGDQNQIDERKDEGKKLGGVKNQTPGF